MIRATNLSKRFGSKAAVDDVSFNVDRGEVLGFLGPNGAGKSTTMRLITGFLTPDKGRVYIGNHNLVEQPIEAKSQIGYLPENAPSYGEMTVDGFLRFTAALRGMGRRAAKKAVDEVIDTCFLQPVRFQTIDTLSKGYTHRTCFAQAILHDPDILVLDEPTDGLDPNQKHEVRTLIQRMAERKAIILSTHILEEVEACCTRILIINNGKLVADGLPDELRARSEVAGSVVLTVHDHPFKDVADFLRSVDGVGKVANLQNTGSMVRVRCLPGKGLAQGGLARRIFDACRQRGWSISELTTEQGRMDEVFRSITTSDQEVSV